WALLDQWNFKPAMADEWSRRRASRGIYVESYHQGGWKPYLRRARNAIKAAAIAASIAPPAIMNAAAAQNFALPASSSASRAPLRISSSSPAAASILFSFKS